MSYWQNRSAFLATIAFTIVMGVTWTAAAPAPRNAAGPVPDSAANVEAADPLAPITTPSRVLRHSVLTSENAVVAIGAGFQSLTGAVTINCPGPGGCLLEVDQHAQVRGTTANNRWAICTRVDGVDMTNPSCPFLGVVPSNGFFVAGAFAQSKGSLAPGNHAVQTFIYTDNGGSRGNFQITHRIYKNK